MAILTVMDWSQVMSVSYCPTITTHVPSGLHSVPAIVENHGHPIQLHNESSVEEEEEEEEEFRDKCLSL